MYNTVIFDIDGTLLDTTAGIRSAVDFVTDKYGMKKLTQEEFKKFISFAPITTSFANTCNTDEKMSVICGDEYTRRYKQGDMYKAKLFNQVDKLLEYLKSNNFKLGVATFKNEDNAKLLLANLNIDKYFDAICGSNKDSGRTKKDILNDCRNLLGAIPQECIFIGDSKTDAVAAEETSIDFIGVTYGFGFKTREDVMCNPNVLCADTVDEILNYISLHR